MASPAHIASMFQSLDEKDICLVNFNNCTSTPIYVLWINFTGTIFEYALLRPCDTITIKTYVAHVWTFKVCDIQGSPTGRSDRRLVALPEDKYINYLKERRGATNLADPRVMASNQQVPTARRRCPLCKSVDKNIGFASQIPCFHVTTQVKFSLPKGLELNRLKYFYVCSHAEHKPKHSQNYRNIFIVEPFQTLKELCFAALQPGDAVKNMHSAHIPGDVIQEFIEFSTDVQRELKPETSISVWKWAYPLAEERSDS